jgi:anti-sigma-K factor RskA
MTDSPAEVVEIVMQSQSSLTELDNSISDEIPEFQTRLDVYLWLGLTIRGKAQIRRHRNGDDLWRVVTVQRPHFSLQLFKLCSS